MRKAIIHGLLAASILGLGFAGAQNVTKSLQINQIGTGSFGVDNSNNAFWPAHMNCGPNTTDPTVAGAGTSATVSGCDVAGEISVAGTAITTITLTFRSAYTSSPYCNANSSRVTAVGVIATPNGVNFLTSAAAPSGDKIFYQCFGRRTG